MLGLWELTIVDPGSDNRAGVKNHDAYIVERFEGRPEGASP